MASQPPSYPSNSNHHAPPSISSQSSAQYTPQSSSIADDSDAEFDPTPLQSPRGGPDFDDLPPSYEDAQHQAVSDSRNGVTPLDASQIEAHRLIHNEESDGPEIWEYRIRGEEIDEAAEHEQAPEYEGTSVPVQHIQNSESVPVGRTGATRPTANAAPVLMSDLTARALEFAQGQPTADSQYAPELTRGIAIPRLGRSTEHQEVGNSGPIQFLRAYAKTLHAHSIQPAEFMAFVDGLNAICIASSTDYDIQLSRIESEDPSSDLVREYIRAANERYFAPRGLRVSMQSLYVLVDALDIPISRGQRNAVMATVLGPITTPERRAQALHPWIEALETNVPALSPQSTTLYDMAGRLRQKPDGGSATNATNATNSYRELEHEDPPHSIPEAPAARDHTGHGISCGGRRHGRGRGGHRGGPCTPFGPSRHGPSGAPGNGPLGPPGNGPFGRPGRGFPGGRGRARGHGPPPFAHTRGTASAGSSVQTTNEWAALGQNLGKMGEEFGRRMGDWGKQFGKQAEVWGQDVGKRANAWSGDVNARNSGSVSGSGPAAGIASTNDDLPPSYEEGHGGQESGVLRGNDAKCPPSYEHVSIGKQPAKVYEDDDDDSSFSSDTSDSDSDSDLDTDDDEVFPDTQVIFMKQYQSINRQTEEAALKGKKSPDEIAQEHTRAIEEAQNEKTAMDFKISAKMSRRSMQRAHKQKRRDLKREYKHKRREIRAAHDGKGKGKGKGKAKKTPEWKQARREYREKRKELRKESLRAMKQWKETQGTRTITSDMGNINLDEKQEGGNMVWLVIDTLDS